MKNIFILISLLLPLEIFGQSPRPLMELRIDSLKSELSHASNDSIRGELLLLVTMNYTRTNPDSSIFFGEQGLELAERIGNTTLSVRFGGFLGDAYRSKGNLPKALEICLESIAKTEEFPQINRHATGPAYSTLGDIHKDLGDYSDALSFYSELVNKYDPDSSNSDPNNEQTPAYGHFGRAEVFVKMGLLDSALYELEKSEQHFRASEVNAAATPVAYYITPSWFNVRADIYKLQNKPDLAFEDLFTTLQMTQVSDQPYFTSNTYSDLAKLHVQLGNADSAINYAKKGLDEANRISYTYGILEASQILAEQLEGSDDSQALYYLKLANATRNKLYGAGNIQVMKDMITQNELRRKEITDAKEAYQNKLWTNGLLGVALILTVGTVLLIRNNRQKQKAKLQIEAAYNQLKSTQAQLIQSEKMASLGELTAGIAHEIQNPLNFVNNFSEVSSEMIEELDEEIEKGDKEEAKAISADIRENLNKITLHGKRADSIVKGMLEHSKRGSGQMELTNLNALAEEFLRLSYQSFLAKEPDFKCELKINLDPNLPKVSAIPQDIGKVLLNLFNNAFYAVHEKAKSNPQDFKPEVIVSSKKTEKGIELYVQDNGPGIPDSIKEKIFQPFFTTKPTGSGTGLGLSLSYDIVKAHGGELEIDTTVNEGTEFIIKLNI